MKDNKPTIGEVRKGRDIGKKPAHCQFIWHTCEDCGKERWVGLVKKLPQYTKCLKCGILSRQSRKGKPVKTFRQYYNKAGYLFIKLSPDDFFYPMTNCQGYVFEHRLVMAKRLSRCLQRWELVHHKGTRYADIRNKSDNLEDNLEMTSSLGEHSLNHSKGYRDGYAKGLQDGKLKQIQEEKF